DYYCYSGDDKSGVF
nr:immunoglobulin light chain junction region [Macaca mulatta]MOV94633.1 immunoglobulin light chain junction region [Macaca mulatta]MOV94707.1 immunoglobulin light chain junction region [Macaca mulatta]MOV94713.1 immunoglobulin light chain junction region [Macaca mulatta]MOV94770.1 immunoglobulin light chain junction region [Macaca mulatta]